MLESEGVVEASPRRGVVVREIGISEIIEIYMIRQALEVLAFQSAARRVTPEELAKAEKYLRDAEGFLAEKNLEAYFQATERFTATLIEAGRLPRVAQLITTYRDQLQRYRKITLSDPERQKDALRQHADILDALRARDPERTGRLVFEHLEGAMKVCERYNTLLGKEAKK
jgi:DNA-binding GntR family transcriptional regulator